jgi:BatD DUF11 like domain
MSLFHQLALRITAFGLLIAPFSNVSSAQQATATVTQKAVYAGEPFLVRIVATRFPEEPEPTCEYLGPSNDRIRVEMGDVSRQQSMFLHSVDGKVTRSTEYRYVYSYQVIVTEPGDVELGQFRVSAGDVVAETRPLTLTCKPVEVDSDLFIEVALGGAQDGADSSQSDSATVYVGEHVPVSLTWGIAGDLLELENVNIACPIFDEFLFRDPPPSEAQDASREQIMLRISGKQGVLEIPATVIRQERDGKRVQAVTSKRILVPNKPGEFEIAPAAISARKISRRRGSLRDPFFPDPFGTRREGDDRPIRALAKPLKITVLPIPTAGRPAAFAGAVGESFGIEVTAKRSVVRVGEPIELTVLIRGGSGLDTAGLPPLSEEVGFPPRDFSYDPTPPAGTWNAKTNEKSFTITIRPLHESIREIPPFQFAWFNPKKEAFQITRSDPISLQVQPTQLVTSKDVISSVKPSVAAPTSNASASMVDDANQPPANDEVRPLATSRDLSITKDLTRLMEDAYTTQRLLWRGTWILAGVSLVFSGWLRFYVDSAKQREERRTLQRLGRAWDAALTDGRGQHVASQLARLLWEARKYAKEEELSKLNQQIQELELIAYAPPGSAEIRETAAYSQPSIFRRKRK